VCLGGNPDGGRWTKDDESSSLLESTIFETAGSNPSSRETRYAALETGTLSDASEGVRTVSPAVDPAEHAAAHGLDAQYAALNLPNYDRTGDPRVDRTTDLLFQMLLRDEALVARALVLLGKAGPALYGILVHTAFARDVGWQELPGIGREGVEQSFSLERIVRYGLKDSIRTDVIMRDESGQIIAIWDVKTGNATLTDDRRQEIRAEVGAAANVPVIELHVCRGVRCKTREELEGPRPN